MGISAVLDTVADQIGIDPVMFELYARRDETRREHLAEIMARLDLRAMQDAGARLPALHPCGSDRCCRHGEGRTERPPLRVAFLCQPRLLGTILFEDRSDPCQYLVHDEIWHCFRSSAAASPKVDGAELIA